MEMTFSMYRAWTLIVIASILLMMVILTNVSAQSGFKEYDNELFTIAYPSTWTVDETGVGSPGSTSVAETHVVKFNTPSNDASVSLLWKPFRLEPTIGQLDKQAWFNRLSSNNTVISIDNQTQSVSGQPALVAILMHGINKEMFIVTFVQVPIGQFGAHGIWIFEFLYTSSRDGYPTYLNQFQTIVGKFHVNA